MKMKILGLSVVVVVLNVVAYTAEAKCPSFSKHRLTDKFYCEGAYFADFNKDGKTDVVAGPFWYEGPNFHRKHEIYTPKAFDPKRYSDVFLTYTGDFNGDGWPDVFHLPHPGKGAFWYENPAGKEVPWKRHFALKDVGNESPVWGDVNGDGRPDLIYNETGYLGYATYDPAKPEQEWNFFPITPEREYARYTHGVGLGYINGDGRIDILEKEGWWEQPADCKSGKPWKMHPVKFAEAAAQLLVYDVNADGLNDVITAWHCHLYGLVWHEQIRNDDGKITWRRHEILSPNPDMDSKRLRVSQLHAFDLVDINGDNVKDIVTGKRFWAHGPTGDVEPDAPAVVYWFELQRSKDADARFIPHLIDDDSGVGTQVAATDINNDGVPDIIVGNKKGTFIHLSQPNKKRR